MATDPWDVFGSDSDEDKSATTFTPTPTPAATAAAVHPPAAKRTERRYAWEVLLPIFRFPPGFTEGGDGPAVGHNAAGARAGSAEAGVGSPTLAPFSSPPVYQHPSVQYEACLPHRGGGRGFVASADIAPGALLLVERRFFPMPTAVECSLAGGVGQEELCLRRVLELPPSKLEEVLGELRWLHPQSLEDLPSNEAEALLSRHDEAAKSMLSKLRRRSSAGEYTSALDMRGIVRLLGALQSNGFASGIYLHPAMLNHSCRPNAVKWRAGKSIADRQSYQRPRRGRGEDNGSNKREEEECLLSEIRATELITKGEEITISYLEPREIARDSRQSRLKEQFGFHCDCALCERSSGSSGSSTSSSSGAATATLSKSTAALEQLIERGREKKAAGFAERHDVGNGNVDGGPSTANGSGGGDGEGVGSQNAREVEEDEDEDEDEDEEEDRGGIVARAILERRLDAAESVIDLSRANEVRWAGVLSEVLGYRWQACQWLSARHISLARADKLIAKACIAILQGEGAIEAAQSDADCTEAVRQASDGLPFSFGGGKRGDKSPPPFQGSFKARLLAVFLSALISRRKTQLLYLGNGPHPETGACLADMSQAMGMLLAQGFEGGKWIERLPGHEIDGDDGGGATTPYEGARGGGGKGEARDGLWWGDGGTSGASLFERECDKAAKRIGRLFDAP